jgi:hypothetical protein
MKPWTIRNQIASALKNEHVRIGQRQLQDGSHLRGIYATRSFAPGDYVASFHGRVISRAELVKLHQTDRPLFEKINEYAVWYEPKGHLFPEDIDQMGAHLINHACAPNARWAHVEQQAMLVVAEKPITEGQEVTVHYGWMGIKAAYEGRQHPCACGVQFCVGTVELNVEMIDHGDGTKGPYLSPKEVGRRLLVDIVHGTDDNERLVHRYGRSATDMIVGAGAYVVAKVDPDAFFAKLQEGARAAVSVARLWQQAKGPVSERRLAAIARAYKVSDLAQHCGI